MPVIYFFSMKVVSYSQETFQDSTKVSAEPPTPEQTPQLESLIHKKEDSLALPKPAVPEASSAPTQDEPAAEGTAPGG